MVDKDGIAEHPLLSKLGAEAGNVMSLRGYVGATTQEGHVRLYPSLDDLSKSVEIPSTDIIHTAEATDSVPPGAMILWIKKGAEVTYHRVESAKTSARALPRAFLGGGARAESAPPEIAAGDVVEVNRGRLRILVRRQRDESCSSRCSVCQSRCQVCQSRCSSRIGRRTGGVNPGNGGNFFGSGLGRLRNR